MIRQTVNLIPDKLIELEWVPLINSAIKKLDPSKEYNVFFSDKAPSRSNDQNKLLWGYMYPEISKLTGHDSEELHEIFLSEFSTVTKKAFGNKIVEYVRRTSDYNTKEMGEFIDKVWRWANENGIHLESRKRLSDEVIINLMDKRYK